MDLNTPKLDLEKLSNTDELTSYRERLRNREKERKKIMICAGTACRSSKSKELIDKFQEQLEKNDLNEVEIKKTGCRGFCEKGPLVVIEPRKIFYTEVEKEDVSRIIEQTIKNGDVIEDLLYEDTEGKKIVEEKDIPFFHKQEKIVLRYNGEIDPTNINEYIKVGGYSALSRALGEMEPEEIIEEIKKSKLRGRGGAGFPTGKKWEFAKKADSEKKFIIGNCDEGDPGAYMDRSTIEGNPQQVIEGMIIGAFAIGAEKGFVYIRSEYPLAVKTLKVAIEQAKTLGLLGENILGTDFNFDLEVFESAGAFVCGEETALMRSIEGKRGRPQVRPPFPAQSGLFGKPTNINNVETLANVPWILRNGPEKFRSIGTEDSGGSKVFTLTGNIRRGGLVEVPIGTTLREVIYDIGGGIADGKDFKAVQIGGPSGGCLTSEHLDTPLDFETLTEAGAIMGSGGLVVVDEDTCMVDMAHYFLSFTQEESCGKCPPCRVGTRKMLDILKRIKAGNGEENDIEHLRRLAKTAKKGSICGLGQTAPNPLLTTLEYFDDEYEAHIKEKRCPVNSCKALSEEETE